MPRGENLAQVATADSRRKGALAAAESKRLKREERERLAQEKLGEHVDKAIETLAAKLESDDDTAALRAAAQILDRTLGRALQRTEHSGYVDVDTDLEDARAGLVARIVDLAEHRKPREVGDRGSGTDG